MTALAAVAGLLVVGGILVAVSAVHPAPVTPRRGRHWHVDPAQLVMVGTVAGVVLLVTRWPVAAVAAGVGGWFAAEPLLRRQRTSDAARAEAIALWVEMLRDTMGTARGVEGVLVATASTAPGPIRAEVQRMARRLAYDPLDAVLDDLGEDLHHPIGDLVVTALRLASKAGARQTRDVLDDLARAAYREAEMYQRVDVARQRPRTAMRWVTVIIGGFIALLILFARDYLHPYGTAVGQVVLVFVCLYWGLGFWWMARMGQVTQTERFLARRPQP